VFLVFFYNQTSNITKREFIDNGKALVKNFSFNCQTGIEVGNESMLHLPILALAQEEDVNYVMIYDSLGEIITTFIKVEGTEPAIDREQLLRIKKGKMGIVTPGRIYDFLAPIARRNPDGTILEALEQSDIIGVVRIGLSTEQIKNLIMRSLRRGILFGVLIVVIVIAVTFILSRQISRPAIAISRQMEAIARGETDLSKRLAVSRKDEIGALAVGFNSFVDTLAKIIREVTASTPQLSEQSSHLASISQQLTAATEEITASVQQIAQSSGTQLKDIYKILEDAKSTKEIAKDTVDSALHSKTTFDKILKLSNEGKSEAEVATQNIGVLMTGIEHLTERINLLYAETEKIPTIVDTINSIAEKTALLALNAAIEAARAGEAGKGFAVVADEVRGLAVRTTDSTAQISTIINELKTRMERTAETMGAVVNGVNHSQETARDTSGVIEQIVREITVSAQANTRISAASREQMANFSVLQTSLDRLFATFGENSTKVETTATIGDDLYRVSESLKSLLSRFKFENRAGLDSDQHGQRSSPRVQGHLRVHGVQKSRAFESICRDFSMTGMQLRTNAPLDEKEKLTLLIFLPYDNLADYGSQKPLKLAARVMWQTPSDSGYSCGVKFDELNSAQQQQLRACFRYFNKQAEFDKQRANSARA
jgi:methyl-accepting chemotaxis protein